MKIITLLARLIKPFTKWIGKVHSPWTHKHVKWVDAQGLYELIEPGDVLISATFGELTYPLTPGPFKHAAIISTDRMVIEAIGQGVSCGSVMQFLITKDRVCLLRPTWCDNVARRGAAKTAIQKVGLPYDYEFTQGNGSYYCSELITDCYRDAWKRTQNDPCPWEHLNGTTLPSDFFRSKNWQVVYQAGKEIK
jgi:uncharacterized protein YycO